MDMTAPTFLRYFRRFVGRRGLPKQIVSDNGKTFVAASKNIKDVKWTFNVPKAPRWGGIFERLVRSVKRCLKKVLGLAHLTYDELLTVLVEIEMVLNTRPLTVVSAEDMEEPLTPSHLIFGHRIRDPPDTRIPDQKKLEVNSIIMTKRVKHLNRTITQFWQRWKKEYLVSLREMHYPIKRSNAPRISICDVVIIHDEQPRAIWKLGIVEELLTGVDGESRAAVLRVSGGGRPVKHLQKLYPIEMTVAEEQNRKKDDPDMNTGENSEPGSKPLVRSRPKRAAALNARDRVMAQFLDTSTAEDDC